MAKTISNKWNVTPQEAIKIQKQLRSQVSLKPLTKEIKYIAGADVSLNRFQDDIFSGIIVLTYPDLEPVTHALFKSKTIFPYIPGLLSFREIPALLEAWNLLTIKPDVLVVDGQGIAHPRRLGIASHLGVLLDIPTIGCAKSVLYGTIDGLGSNAGSRADIHDRYNPEEIIGASVRTKDNVKPIIISPGHKINLEDSVTILSMCVRGYRIPEPTRLAHELVNEFRRNS